MFFPHIIGKRVYQDINIVIFFDASITSIDTLVIFYSNYYNHHYRHHYSLDVINDTLTNYADL
jgi:hypothetical protein